MSISRLTELNELQTTIVNAKRTIGLQEELFISGKAFTARDVLTSPAATDLYIHFDAKATTGIQIIFNPLQFVAAEAGPIVITYYVNPTLTAGGRTEIIGSNRRATSSNPYKAIIEFVAPGNVSAPGTKFSAQLVPSSSGGGAQPNSGAGTVQGLPFEINPSMDSLLKIDNTNGDDTLFEYNIDWFEVEL